MNSREIIEAEAIHRQDALQRIAELVKRHGITQSDLLSILPNPMSGGSVGDDRAKSKLFDPSFDVR